MKLRNAIKKKYRGSKSPQRDCARDLGVHESLISHLCREHNPRKCSRQLAPRLLKLLDGAITLEELLYPEDKQLQQMSRKEDCGAKASKFGFIKKLLRRE